MNGKSIAETKEEKDLGILMDDNFKFRKHCASVVKKSNSSLAIIKRTFANLNEKTVPILFKSIVRPQLEYGNVIWGPFMKTDQKNIERIQRRATKLIPALKNSSYDERIFNLNLPSLMHRRRRHDMIYTYKIMTSIYNIDKEQLFKVNDTKTRGHRYKIFTQKCNKLVRKNFFSNRVIKDWNSLPEDIIEAKNLNIFKKELDHHWIDDKFINPFNL